MFIIPFLITALCIWGLIASLRQKQQVLNDNWPLVVGTITHVRHGRHSNSQVSVDFTTESGDLISISNIGYYVSTMQVGDEISLYYNPENPNKIFLKASGGMGIIFFLIMIIFTAVVGCLTIVL